jgi:hypothetical protein
LQLRVLGTAFAVTTNADGSSVTVSHGLVEVRNRLRDEVRRLAGGETLQIVRVHDSDVTAPPTDPMALASAKMLAEDFSNGLPANWEEGTWMNTGLPAGDTGAVAAILRKRPDGQQKEALSSENRLSLQMPPFFIMTKTSAVDLTLRSSHPDLCAVLFVLFPPEGQGTNPVNLIHDFSGLTPGGWTSATVPLSQFRIEQNNPPDKQITMPQLIGWRCYRYTLYTWDQNPLLALSNIHYVEATVP